MTTIARTGLLSSRVLLSARSSALHARSPALAHRFAVYRPLSTTPSLWQQVQENKAPVESQSRIRQLYQKSKELVTFYKDGLKLLWSNNKQAKALLAKVDQGNYNLDRNEYQLIHRSKKDMVKLIPFGIIFLILPESIPLWVIFVPSIIPSTCLTPAQIEKQRKKLDAARQIRSASVIRQSKNIPGISAEDFLSKKSFIRIAKHYNEDFDLNRINRQNLMAMCRFMGLPGWGTRGMVQKRLDKHIEYLTEDDKLIARQGGVNTLSLTDLQQAVEERGMRSIGVDEDQLRKSLDYWISLQLGEPPISPGLLIFSRQFVLNSTYK